MRAALGLALILGGSVLALMALQGHVPLAGSTSDPASGGVATARAAQRGGGLP